MKLTAMAAVLLWACISIHAQSEPFSPEIYDSVTDSLEQSRAEEKKDTVLADTTREKNSTVSENTLSQRDTLLAQGDRDGEQDQQEEVRPQRVFRTAGLGPAGFIYLESENLAYSAYYGGVVDVNPFVNGRLVGELSTDFTDGLMGGLELGVDIFTSEGILAPYFGAGFGGGFARGAGENTFGFGISGNAGVYLFKDASLQINLQGRLYALLSQIETHYPLYYTFRAGILF
ncbi:MAG: hypothetical protein ACLFQB_11590 [Chitinispirillaceae bacterium]